MRVFVGYHYDHRQSWIPELVVPMLECLGLHVVDGKHLPEGPVNGELQERIERCDALIGFLTRDKGRWTRQKSSDYVRQELEYAWAHEKHVIAVVEKGVERPAGFLGAYQRLDYQDDSRDQLLVMLAKHVSELIRGEVKLRLLPQQVLSDLGPDLARGDVACVYRIQHDAQIVLQRRALIFPEGEGLFTKITGLLPGRSVQVSIESRAGVKWASTFTPHATPFTVLSLSRSGQ